MKDGPILSVHGVTKRYPGVTALDGVDLEVPAGEVRAIIGPNGAGKSTLFGVISGQDAPTTGSVRFEGGEVAGMAAWKLTRQGMGRTFQVARVFAGLTVRENVHGALSAASGESRRFLSFGVSRGLRRKADALLTGTGLQQLAHRPASTLAQGDRKRLEIAVALALDPHLLLLDEPTAGMSPPETAATVAVIKRLWAERHFTMLLTEHDMSVVFGLAQVISVMHHGRVLRTGSPEEISQDPIVLEVYLGQASKGATVVERRPAAKAALAPLLEVISLSSWYGTAQVIFDLNLTVRRGELLALLGRNGAGKSTTLKSLMRLDVRTTGTIAYAGRELQRMGTPSVARLGLGFVPEDRRIYPALTVRENLRLGRNLASKDRPPIPVDRIVDIFPLLKPLLDRPGGGLSGGEQQLLAIARCMVGNPSLILMDEPSEGLAPVIVEQLGEAIRRLREEAGVAVLLAEQNATFALGLADRVAVIDGGRLVFEGAPEELAQRPDLQRLYLGVAAGE